MEQSGKEKSISNFAVHFIDSLESYISTIYDIYNNFQPKSLVFRGHKSKSYELIPGVGRKDANLTIEQEKSIFYEFKRNYRRFYPLNLENDVDIMMLAQHYGLKTRLLDWSYNPFIALYMAVQQTSEKIGRNVQSRMRNEEHSLDGVVYIKKISNNKIEKGNKKNPFSFKKNTLLVPENFEIRFVNQEGLFEIFPEPTKESLKNIIHKIFIKEEYKENIKNKIEMMGITKLFVYPTLENLCSATNELFNKS